MRHELEIHGLVDSLQRTREPGPLRGRGAMRLFILLKSGFAVDPRF
jgi:hypothetical protein